MQNVDLCICKKKQNKSEGSLCLFEVEYKREEGEVEDGFIPLGHYVK